MKGAPNKMISNEEIREYHFAGTGVHPPFSVTASNADEAEEKRKEKLGIVIVKNGHAGELAETDASKE